jgi:hypothetical protein
MALVHRLAAQGPDRGVAAIHFAGQHNPPDLHATSALWRLLLETQPDPVIPGLFACALIGRSTPATAPDWRPLVEEILATCHRLLDGDPDPGAAVLPGLAECRLLESDLRIRELFERGDAMMRRLPGGHPIRLDIRRRLVNRYACSGLLADLTGSMGAAEAAALDPVMRCADACERGDAVTAAGTAPAATAIRAGEFAPFIDYGLALLGLMGLRQAGRPPVHDWAREDIAVQRALLAGDRSALAGVRLRKPFSFSLSCAILPIHVALARGEIDAARVMCARRRERAPRTPSDILFDALLARADGDAGGTRRLLTEALDAAEHYRSLPRLDFELRLQRISRTDLLRIALPHGGAWRPAGAATAASVGGDAATGMAGASPAMQAVRAAVAAAAASDPLTVLIVGETGTGKELAARAVHAGSARREQPFVALNCAAMNDELLLAELFGHTRGAFTGAGNERAGLIAEARGGTLLLDEVGDASPHLQAALLRWLESGEYRRLGEDKGRRSACRVLAATNVDLDAAVAAGRFREDLRYRLARQTIALPPLRQRSTDIPVLLTHWLGHIAIDPGLAATLQQRPWPGNLRELRNAAEVLASQTELPDPLDLPAWERLVPQAGLGRPAAVAANAAPVPGAASGAPPSGRPPHDRLQAARDLLRARGVMTRNEPTPAPRTHFFRWRG